MAADRKDVNELAHEAADVLESTLEAVREIRNRIVELPSVPWFEVVLTGKVSDSLTRSWNVICHFVDYARGSRDEFLNIRTELADGTGFGCSVELADRQANIVSVSLTRKGALFSFAEIAEEADALMQAIRDNYTLLDEAYERAWVSEDCRKLRRANVNLYYIENELAGCEEELD